MQVLRLICNHGLMIFFFLSSSFMFLFFQSESYAGDGREYISFSTAVFDILQQESTAFEGRIEYRGTKIYSDFKPITGIMLNTSGTVHLFAGVCLDIPLFSFLDFSPSFAPGVYFCHDSKDLNFLLEFRSQIELAFKLAKEIKVGVSFNHISNASLGSANPGVESIAITYHFPL